MKKRQTKNTKSNKANIVLISIVIILVVSLAVLLYFLLRKKKSNNNNTTTTTTNGTTTTSPYTTTTTVPGPTPKPDPSTTTTKYTPTGKIIPFPQPALPNNYPIKPVKTVTINGGWQDYATTTQFGSGDSMWPGNDNSLTLDIIRSFGGKLDIPSQEVKGNPFGNFLGNIKINNTLTPVFGPMGAALPWAEYAKISENRNDFITKVKNSAKNGKGSYAYIVQPMNKFPKDLLNISTDSVSSNLNKINDDTNVATFKDTETGQDYFMPAFLIIPYEGCGGDCSVDTPDCFNSMDPTQLNNFITDFNYFNGKDCESVGNAKTMCLIAQGDNNQKWFVNPIYDKSSVQKGLYSVPVSSEKGKNNSYFAITDLTDFGTNIAEVAKKQGTNHVNYCSGANMHFDIAEQSPLWSKFISISSNYNITSIVNLVDTNGIDTVVRFIRVPGNIFGELDLDAPPGPGQCPSHMSCPAGYYDGGKDGCPAGIPSIKPGDPNWDPNNCANHECCKLN